MNESHDSLDAQLHYFLLLVLAIAHNIARTRNNFLVLLEVTNNPLTKVVDFSDAPFDVVSLTVYINMYCQY